MSKNEQSLVLYENNLLTKLGNLFVNKNIDVGMNDNIKASSQNITIFDDEVSCDKYLKELDPKIWKNQDHYKVLGLSKMRINATENDIKKSYRRIVLRHHPDKQTQSVDLECHYFSCITRAYEILSDPIKRRSYDSVDSLFDNTIPNPTTYNKNRFFEIFTPVFDRNARWSNVKPVPSLGNENSSYEEVNDFYNFWYNFDSWREYSYLDEEEKEKGENREERRYLDKQNKIARNQRKKEEMQRIRLLVDNAYQCDPRVVRFKEEEKKRKQKFKLDKLAKMQAKKDEEERLRKEKENMELEEKERIEQEEKRKKEMEKKQKEMLKKKIRKEVKQLETILEKKNYFTSNIEEKIDHMKEFDKLCKIYTMDELILFRQNFEKCDDQKSFFLNEIKKLNEKLEIERTQLTNTAANSSNSLSSNNSKNSKKAWSYDDIQLIIKAVKLFPAGTHNRWTVIAKYINDKTDSNVVRNHRDVLEKAKDLQSSNELNDLKEEVNKNAFKKLETQVAQNSNVSIKSKDLNPNPSQRYDAVSQILEVNDNPWTNEEQQLLEQAMKTFPSNLGTERWNLIAECIPNRSRADCVKRYKYLVEQVKAKNFAKAVGKK